MMDEDEMFIERLAILLIQARVKYSNRLTDLKMQTLTEYKDDLDKAEAIWKAGLYRVDKVLDSMKNA